MRSFEFTLLFSFKSISHNMLNCDFELMQKMFVNVLNQGFAPPNFPFFNCNNQFVLLQKRRML